MKIVKVKPNSAEIKRLCSRSVAPTKEIQAKVDQILFDVRTHGLPKVIEYAKAYDGLKGNRLRVSESVIEKAAQKTPPALQKALKQAIRNVKVFHQNQVEESWQITGKDGVVLGQRIRPMRRVGLYVPGGSGTYPSTVIMCAVPAIVAGVSEIVVVTPIKDGLQPSLAFVLRELCITEVYHVGGAQAIGLLAYGAKGIEPVDKIVGPSNVFAAIAKKEVFGVVDIDMLAGPSEILVLADSTCDPDFVAADLLSQAEHGSGFEAAICITDNMETAQMISACADRSEEHTSELQSPDQLVCRLLLEKKKDCSRGKQVLFTCGGIVPQQKFP